MCYTLKEVVKVEKLEDMINIGSVVANQLRQVGIDTPEKLRQIGAKQAWLKVQEIDSSACIHRLYSFQGAILSVKKTELDYEIKKDLKEFYLEHRL